MPDALAWLAENERSFRALVSSLAGRTLSRSTTWKWLRGQRKPSTTEAAFLELLRRKPELLDPEESRRKARKQHRCDYHRGLHYGNYRYCLDCVESSYTGHESDQD